jgi:DNA-binding NarL/FixJ family response regulator
MENKQFIIGVVDDHFAIRDGYKSLLEKLDYIQDVKTYESIGEFQNDYKSNKCDLIFLDIELPNENGLDACRDMKNHNSNLKIIILSAYHSEQYVLNAYNSNADGYLFKDATKTEVQESIQKVLFSDEKYFNHEALSVIFRFQESSKKNKVNSKTLLSDREIQILKLICEGKSNDQISSMLNRTSATIATHRQNIMNKIGAHNSLELINYAMSNGFYVPNIQNLKK